MPRRIVDESQRGDSPQLPVCPQAHWNNTGGMGASATVLLL